MGPSRLVADGESETDVGLECNSLRNRVTLRTGETHQSPFFPVHVSM